MQRTFTSVLAALALTGAMAVATAAAAQNVPDTVAEHQTTLKLAFTYQGTLSDLVSGSHFWMQGGSAQHGQFYDGACKSILTPSFQFFPGDCPFHLSPPIRRDLAKKSCDSSP